MASERMEQGNNTMPTYCNTISHWFPLGHDRLLEARSPPHGDIDSRRHSYPKFDCTGRNHLTPSSIRTHGDGWMILAVMAICQAAGSTIVSDTRPSGGARREDPQATHPVATMRLSLTKMAPTRRFIQFERCDASSASVYERDPRSMASQTRRATWTCHKIRIPSWA